MKKFSLILLMAAMLSFSFFGIHANATDTNDQFVVNGVGYRFNDSKDALLITCLTEDTGIRFHVPAEVNGYPVQGFDTDVISDCEHWNSIETLTFSDGINKIADYSCFGMPSLKVVVLPSSVTEIGEGAFADCLALKRITLSSNLTSIGNEAFANCFSLKSINLPKGIKKIGDYAFSGSGLKEMTLPATVSTVGKYAFYGCQDLTDLAFSSRMKSVPTGVAKYCTSLETVKLPSKAESIGKEAFYNCTNLKTVQVPNRVTTIYTYAFANCYSLERVSIGSAVTKITASAFVGSEQIAKLIFKGTEPPTMAKSLYLPENTLIRVPEGCLKAYKDVLASNTYVRRYKLQMNEYK